MPRVNNSVENRLLSKVSSMYYDQDYNQQEIADRLQLSRPKVSRLLKKAREKGIVQISIVSPHDNFLDLENSLEEKFHLKEVLIVDVDDKGSDKGIKRQIGAAAANYLHRTLFEGEIIGVSWGTTLQAMLDSMLTKPIDNLHVVQTLGGVGPPEAKAHTTEISRRLAQLLNSSLTLLPSPGIVESIEAKKVLLSDRRVRGASELFSRIDTLYVGLGSIKTNTVLDPESKEISSHLYKEIVNSNAVGDISLHFIDINGQEVDTHLKDLVIGISLEEIKQIDTVVGIAGGPEKTDVIYGALNGKLIDVLITDDQTARNLLSK